MKMEIKLPDPKYCNGCPCCYDYLSCQFFDKMFSGYGDDFSPRESEDGMILRPQICKDKNGE
jgi:hypothetical protein